MVLNFSDRLRSGRATVCCVFGTRPEAIKLAPLIKALQRHPRFDARVLVTAQHREMLDQVLDSFGISPDADLRVMEKEQSLLQLSSLILDRLQAAFQQLRPDLVVVQGDTLTTFCGALGAYFLKVPLAHVEAGLRTRDKFSPFPEEMNRLLTSRLADWHFAPTESARRNLLAEGIQPENVFVTGNTVIDALLEVARRTTRFSCQALSQVPFSEKRVLLATAHRRESFGLPYEEICRALRDVLQSNPDVHLVFPMHLNPQASEPARRILGHEASVTLLPPLAYPDLVLAMRSCWAVVTDSGGLQEEAPAFGKPVLVMREKTERPEAVEAGTVRLAGNCYQSIHDCLQELLQDGHLYGCMSRAVNPYGDGKAVHRILQVFERGTLDDPFVYP